VYGTTLSSDCQQLHQYHQNEQTPLASTRHKIDTVKNIKILTNSNQQTQSYKFTSHITAFPSMVLITEMLEICIQTSYDQNVQLILKSYLPVVYGTLLKYIIL
jgi:hypothetical protein